MVLLTAAGEPGGHGGRLSGSHGLWFDSQLTAEEKDQHIPSKQ